MDSALDASLNDWDEEFSAGSSKTRAEKHKGLLSKDAEPTSGTKDPTKSLKCDYKLQKKSEKAPSTGSGASKTAVVIKTVTKPSRSSREKSAPKERRSGSQKSATPGQSLTTDVAALLKEAFSGLAVEMNKGFSNLGDLLKAKNAAACENNASVASDSESDDRGGGSDIEPEEPARKKQKTDDGIALPKDNSDILNKLEKEFNVSEQDGAEIHGNLAAIVQKLLKDKPEEDKLNEIKKRYLRPKNCDMLAETRVNLPIWNNLSERARTLDLKFQKGQKSLIKGTTAVVQVVNDLISKPDMPSKGQLVNQLMDGVLLMANSNTELNLRRREALKPELHTSYRYLCAPSNPITTELFGDDLPKAMSAEIREGSDFSTVGGSCVAHTGLVAPATKPSCGKSINAPTRQGPPHPTTVRDSTSSEKANETDGMSLVRQYYETRGVSKSAVGLLMASWRGGTKKQY
ncbi:unnamed protein product, partial [Porites evermanni]